MVSMDEHGSKHVRVHVFMIFASFKKCKKIGMPFIFNYIRLGQAGNFQEN